MQHLSRQGRSRTRTSGHSRGGTTCQRIANAYGGRIWAESDETVGSTFYVAPPKRATSPGDAAVVVASSFASQGAGGQLAASLCQIRGLSTQPRARRFGSMCCGSTTSSYSTAPAKKPASWTVEIARAYGAGASLGGEEVRFAKVRTYPVRSAIARGPRPRQAPIDVPGLPSRMTRATTAGLRPRRHRG